MVRIAKRRRREGKTDYKARLGLLKSGAPRITFRKTNTGLISQYITSKEAQDKVEFTVYSKDLLKFGWPAEAKCLKNLTAAYFTGLLIGKKAQEIKSEKKPIVDLGMLRTLYKSKVYAFIKGLNDSGLEIPCDDACFPDEKRIKGEHLKNKIPFEDIKSKVGGGGE